MFQLNATTYTTYNNLSDEELIRQLECSALGNRPLVAELGERLDRYTSTGETIDGNTESDFRDACVAHLQDVSGEDFHAEWCKMLEKAMNVKKKSDRDKIIRDVIEQMERKDLVALHLIEAIKADGVIH